MTLTRSRRLLLAALFAVLTIDLSFLVSSKSTLPVTLALSLLGCGIGLALAYLFWPLVTRTTAPPPTVVLILYLGSGWLGWLAGRGLWEPMWLPMVGGFVLGLHYRAKEPVDG